MNPLTRRLFLAGGSALALSSCSTSKFRTYDGPEVTRIVVMKGDRKMYLLNGTEVLKDYTIGLGFAPEGHKQFEGDGKTPEGRYFIDRHNPASQFHLSVGISYPNQADKEYAASQGKTPGGDIFIHGQGSKELAKGRKRGTDWTAGCIAVTNKEIEEIYAMVQKRTAVDIFP